MDQTYRHKYNIQDSYPDILPPTLLKPDVWGLMARALLKLFQEFPL